MVADANGEMVPVNNNNNNTNTNNNNNSVKDKKHKSKHRSKDGKHKKHKSKHRSKDGKHKSKHGKDKDRKRSKHRDKDGKKRSSSRSRDKDGKRHRKHKSKHGKDKSKNGNGNESDSPPPPPPPSGGGKLGVPGSGGNNSDDDQSSSSATSDSDDMKNAALEDTGNLADASTVFKNEVSKSKKRKGKHGRFESKNQFIRRRPVSGVPMSVQKQLHGVRDDKVSSHLKLIHSKRCEKTSSTISFLKECLLKEVLFQGMDDNMINEIVDVMYRVDCPKGECIIRQNEYGDAYFVIQSGSFDILHQEMEKSSPKIVGEMLPGKAFGEGSLLYSIPRAATLKATKACIVWALDASKFLEIRQKYHNK